MSMTREEALEELERLLRHWDDLENDKRCFWGYDKEAVALALSALRSITREQVEKAWRGEWKCQSDCGVTECTACKWNIEEYCGDYNFCPHCGAPMNDEAIQMVMERLEEVRDEKG